MVDVDVLDATFVAKRLGCAVTTVEERARSGDLPGVKFGDGWVFPAAALNARLNEIALEQAAQRRKPPPRSAVLHDVKRERKVRQPPTLPAA